MYDLLADTLVHATWGLVIATFLLVIAATIPVVMNIRERWLTLAEQAARVIPPLHILASRVAGVMDEVVKLSCEFRGAQEDINEQLEMLEEIIADAPKLGLRFVSDLFIARHLLTQARISCERCWHEARGREAHRVNELNGLIKLAHAQLKGALESIRQAEQYIPRRKIAREDFWSRFTRLSAERVERNDE
jgi:hypothetical protein